MKYKLVLVILALQQICVCLYTNSYEFVILILHIWYLNEY